MLSRYERDSRRPRIPARPTDGHARVDVRRISVFLASGVLRHEAGPFRLRRRSGRDRSVPNQASRGRCEFAAAPGRTEPASRVDADLRVDAGVLPAQGRVQAGGLSQRVIVPRCRAQAAAQGAGRLSAPIQSVQGSTLSILRMLSNQGSSTNMARASSSLAACTTSTACWPSTSPTGPPSGILPSSLSRSMNAACWSQPACS